MNKQYFSMPCIIKAGASEFWDGVEFYNASLDLETIEYNGEQHNYNDFITALEVIFATMTSLEIAGRALPHNSDSVEYAIGEIMDSVAEHINNYTNDTVEYYASEDYAYEIEYIVHESMHWQDSLKKHVNNQYYMYDISETMWDYITDNITEFCNIVIKDMFIPKGHIIESFCLGEIEIPLDNMPFNDYGVSILHKQAEAYLDPSSYGDMLAYVDMSYTFIYWVLNEISLEQYIKSENGEENE